MVFRKPFSFEKNVIMCQVMAQQTSNVDRAQARFNAAVRDTNDDKAVKAYEALVNAKLAAATKGIRRPSTKLQLERAKFANIRTQGVPKSIRSNRPDIAYRMQQVLVQRQKEFDAAELRPPRGKKPSVAVMLKAYEKRANNQMRTEEEREEAQNRMANLREQYANQMKRSNLPLRVFRELADPATESFAPLTSLTESARGAYLKGARDRATRAKARTKALLNVLGSKDGATGGLDLEQKKARMEKIAKLLSLIHI